MENQNEQLDPQVEALLISKSYEQLSAAEINMVTRHITAEQYRAFREVLLSLEAMKQEEKLLPDPKVQTQLINQFRQTHAQPSFWTNLRAVLQYPIPSWQVGLACVVLCLGTYFLSGQNQAASQKVDGTEINTGHEGKVILTSRSAAEEKALLVLLTGVK